jgi:hypothetical protein
MDPAGVGFIIVVVIEYIHERRAAGAGTLLAHTKQYPMAACRALLGSR